MNLWLVRHAQPCIARGGCYGALDLAADVQATQAAAAALAAALPQAAMGALVVWVSPLQRCELLAQALCGLRPDLTYKTEPRLAEMNFGQWEGVPWADIPRAAMDAWTADFGEHRFGGVESANSVLARVAAAWADMANTPTTADQSPTVPAVWITHAGVMRAAHLLAQGVRQVQHARQWPQAVPGYGQWCQEDFSAGFQR